MKNNLNDKDILLRKDLEYAGINVIEHNKPNDGEIPSCITGRLPGIHSDWVFKKLWYCWDVRKQDNNTPGLPLHFAKKIYEKFNGKIVRVEGHIGCPAPDEIMDDKKLDFKDYEYNKYPWLTFFDKNGKKLISQKLYDSYINSDDEFIHSVVVAQIDKHYNIVPDIYKVGLGYVQSYHVDTKEGLKALADVIKESIKEVTVNEK